MIIHTTPTYFGHDWTLHVNGKAFYLGQDVKFCSRVLGMSGSEVVSAIGDADLSKIETRESLARFIVDELGLTEEQIDSLQSWELCCQ